MEQGRKEGGEVAEKKNTKLYTKFSQASQLIACAIWWQWLHVHEDQLRTRVKEHEAQNDQMQSIQDSTKVRNRFQATKRCMFLTSAWSMWVVRPCSLAVTAIVAVTCMCMWHDMLAWYVSIQRVPVCLRGNLRPSRKCACTKHECCAIWWQQRFLVQ